MCTTGKLAVLVGCSYHKTPNRLYAPKHDVVIMRDLLKDSYQFNRDDITILTDEGCPSENNNPPTAENVRNALRDMINRAGEGDILFFYFSGNGTLMHEINEGTPAIVCCDSQTITVNDFRNLVNLLPNNARFTAVCDSSYSGGLSDQKPQIAYNVPEHVPQAHHGTDRHRKTIPVGSVSGIRQSSNVSAHSSEASDTLRSWILLSSSQAKEESMEKYPNDSKEKAYSPFTKAIQEAVTKNAELTNKELIDNASNFVDLDGFRQRPGLYCSDNDAGATFLGPEPRAN